MEGKKSKNKNTDRENILDDDPAIVKNKKKEEISLDLDSESDEETLSKKTKRKDADADQGIKKDDDEIKPKIVYKIEETELLKLEIEKNIYLRVVDDTNRRYVDIRRFYKGYPTKKGIRFNFNTYKTIRKMLDKI